MTGIKERLNNHPALKKLVHRLLVPAGEARPRMWVKWLVNPFIHLKQGKIRRNARTDLFPFQAFSLGKGAVVEDFAVLNNGVGELHIGQGSRVGIGSVLIGPVSIGDNCLLAQHVVISGLNHCFADTTRPIKEQGVETAPVTLADGCWIGANASITAGVRIGKNAVVGAGSVVTRDVPDFAVAVGNPARVVKILSAETAMSQRAGVDTAAQATVNF